MSTASKHLLSLALIILLLITLASCRSTPPGTELPDTTLPDTTLSDSTLEGDDSTAEATTEAPLPPPDGLLLAGPSLDTICTVTYPASDSTLQAAAEALIAYINGIIPNAQLRAVADNVQVDTEYRITVSAADSALSSGYAVKLSGKEITLSGKTTETVLDAVNYFKSCCLTRGYLAIDEALSFTSSTGPEVLSQYPEKYYYYEDVYTPSLAYTFDAKTVDTSKSRLVVSGEDLTDKAVWGDGIVTLTGYTVGAGDHTVLVALANKKGDVEVFETTFSCGDGSVMHLYKGEIHAHTSDSDGKQTILEAYTYARDVAKLDFFAVTDHSNSFSNETYQNKHLPNADQFNDPGTFAALYGYEQTYNINTGYYGHLNTINRVSLTSRNQHLDEFYKLMSLDEDAVVMFNHPGYTWGNFVEYDLYSPEIDAVLNLTEIKSTSAANYEYALSLTKGWHVSPVYNEDNHEANWGAAKDACGYVLAPALTRQNIIDAFNKNRTYTTTDQTLKIYYQINGEWMGARLDNPDNLHFSVQLSTELKDGLGVISIIAEDGIIVASYTVGSSKSYTWEFDLAPLYDYYYVKVESGSNWCYTAPIWIENREQLTVDEMDLELVINTSDKSDQRVQTTVTNNSAETMTNVTVTFYLSSISGLNLAKTSPSATITVGDIAPGASVTVHADLRYNASIPRAYAIVKGTQNGKDYGAVKYMEISTVYFSEILPFTSRGGEDAFEFIELYNNSDAVLNLANYKMRYYVKAGAKAADLEANTWTLSGQIQPHSTLVLWIVSSSSKLTIADFNKNFGTSLVEGKDIVRIVGANIPHSKPVQLELLYGSYVVARAWYNWGANNDMRLDRSVVFNYPTNYTMTAQVAESRVIPTPGKLDEGQMPETVG